MPTTITNLKKLIKQERERQQHGLILIPSENYADPEILAQLTTPLTNKYAEGYPGQRYYSGNYYIDQIEQLAKTELLALYNLSNQKWHANVQPHSGSTANLAAYLAVLQPGDKVLALDLAPGGHLTHGSPVSLTGQLYDFHHYQVDPTTHRLDYQAIAAQAQAVQPKLIVCGATAYPRTIDFKKFATIAKSVNALLLADISHLAGLIATGVQPSPFPYADIVTSTTHKTLAGPRGAFIISRVNLAKAIDKAVFPGLQGGPFENVIAAKAICFALARTTRFQRRQIQTLKNAQALAHSLLKHGLTLISGGTDNHLLLIDCRPLGLAGKTAADRLASVDIYTNANMIPFDPASPRQPSGLRLGTPAVTTRGLKEKELRLIGSWIATLLAEPTNDRLAAALRRQVHQLTRQFPIAL